MRYAGRLVVALTLVAMLSFAPGCQRTVEVQTGTRTVDSQGRVISEDIRTLRVPPETAGAYRINVIVQPTQLTGLASLYADAQTALAAGDLKTAAQKLAEVIAISPTYRKAKQQADAISKGQKVVPDTTSPSPTTPTTSPTSTATTKPPAAEGSSLLRWMPDVLTGFTAQKPAVDPLSVSREYVPKSGNPASRLVIASEQFRTSADAKRALDLNVKRRYTKNASSSTINGHAFYFGTDGRQLAAIGFTDGAVMIALEASPDSGSPATMKSLLEDALRQLP